MIRRADHFLDFWHILDLTEEFNSKYYHKPLDKAKTSDMISDIIEYGVCFVSDNGYIGGVVTPDPFRDANALVELGWFAKDNSGIKLLDAFIAEGRELGVDEIRMCTMSTSPVIAEKIILRKGFTVAETQYRL